MRRALLELADYAAEDPALAAGVFSEVHVAGGVALRKRVELAKRLARAVDSARKETRDERHDPPEATADFIVAAIEAAVIKSLQEETSLSEVVPDLLFIAVSLYFGASTARRAIRDHPPSS
jgi:hypothetical protein